MTLHLLRSRALDYSGGYKGMMAGCSQQKRLTEGTHQNTSTIVSLNSPPGKSFPLALPDSVSYPKCWGETGRVLRPAPLYASLTRSQRGLQLWSGTALVGLRSLEPLESKNSGSLGSGLLHRNLVSGHSGIVVFQVLAINTPGMAFPENPHVPVLPRARAFM